jgi:tetratricopeptide (TPR) repeat protein
MSKETYEHMYQTDPKSWRVHQVLSQSFEQAERLEDAAKQCQQAIDLKPNEPGLHQQLGDIYWKQNHLEKAETECQNELKLNPRKFHGHVQVGNREYRAVEAGSSSGTTFQGIEGASGIARCALSIGRAEAQLGNNQAAIRDFAAVVNGKGECGS